MLSARGSQFERGFAFGTARQLLARAVAAVGAEQDAGLFAGSAAPARPLFEAAKDAALADAHEVAAGFVEGLSVLIANLAAHDRAGLLVAVDDAQWCDRDSLRVLARTTVAPHDGRPAAAPRLPAPSLERKRVQVYRRFIIEHSKWGPQRPKPALGSRRETFHRLRR